MTLVVFNLFINGLDSGTKCVIGKFAEDTKWGRRV